MKKILILLISSLIFSCNSPDKTLSKEDLIETNQSLMIVFDSLMEEKVEIPQLIDSVVINPQCLSEFNKLARETGGEVKIVANSKFVAKVISEIIDSETEDNTDLMIIIDKTGSMADDLDNIKKGLDQILSSIKQKNNIRLSVSTYGDKNNDGAKWYDFQNFETDFKSTMNFIENIKVTGGGDFPESVYDGIYESFQEGFWNSESKRIVILIGDAPSLDSTKSSHTEQEIIDLAKAEKINMNFYPIVLSPYNGQIGNKKKMQNLTFIESVYPNPSKGEISIRLNQLGTFNFELFDQNGKIIKSESINSDFYKTDLYDHPNGLYIVRISDEDKNYDTRKIILEK